MRVACRAPVVLINIFFLGPDGRYFSAMTAFNAPADRTCLESVILISVENMSFLAYFSAFPAGTSVPIMSF